MKKSNTPDFEKAEPFLLAHFEKLSPSLTYHSVEHTLDVLDASLRIAKAENIPGDEINLLRISVLLHDSGFVYVYKNHEEKGCELAREWLPQFGFMPEQVQIICGMIMATKTPQEPKTKLEEIIADADLDYLGRDDVYEIAGRLFEELKAYGFLTTENEWNNLQIRFLKEHHYFTAFSKAHRQPGKHQYLEKLIAEQEG